MMCPLLECFFGVQEEGRNDMYVWVHVRIGSLFPIIVFANIPDKYLKTMIKVCKQCNTLTPGPAPLSRELFNGKKIIISPNELKVVNNLSF